jgi:hypothetical protein
MQRVEASAEYELGRELRTSHAIVGGAGPFLSGGAPEAATSVQTQLAPSLDFPTNEKYPEGRDPEEYAT